MLNIRPLDAFGAEVTGIDLRSRSAKTKPMP